MKHDLKISRLAIICVLCTAVSGAYGASSVRALGGAGTYASASDAAAAGSGGAANSTASVRGGSLRVTPDSGASGTATSISTSNTTSGRVATSPRLSIGHYLGGGTAVSGGSSLRPSGGGSSSSGGGSSSGGDTNPDVSGLRQDVDDLMREVEDLHTADSDIHESIDILRDETQGKLIPGADGYIIIEDDNEIFVDVDALQADLNLVAGQDGREVELGDDEDNLLWRYVGDSDWDILIPKSEITGPQGEKGEPGDPANLDAYSTTEQMNAAIGAAIANLADTYATIQYVDDKLSTKADKATTLAGYGISDAMNREEITKAIADATSDIVGSAEIEQFKTDVAGLKTAVGDANSGLVKSVNDLSGNVTALDGELETVSQLAGSAASTATGAAESAAQALAGLTGKEDVLNKKTTLTDSDTDYPSTSAVTAALADKANVDDVPTTVAELTDASNYVTTDGLSGAISTATENMVTDTELTDALAGKADKATTLAGYGITDAYTTAQIDEKLEDVAVGGMEGMEQVLAGKQDVSNLVQVVSEGDTTKYPSGAAVYKELETKANASELDTLEQTVGQLDTTINAEGTGLADQIGAANTAASAAQTAAEEAAQTAESVQANLALKQDVSAREPTTITNDETKYPSSAAVTAALAAKADASVVDDLQTTVSGEDGTGGLVQQISELTENVTNVTENVTNITEQVSEITNPDTGVQSQITNITNIIGNGESGLVADVADAKAAAEKASQDVAGKQDALTAEQLKAVNSGITAEKVSVYDGYADTIADKQDALGYTAENAANKTDDMTADTGSTTKYPTVHAVEAYVTNTVAEGVEINTGQIAAGAVKTDQIGDGAVTKPKLHQDLQDEIDGKANTADLKALAYKEQIRDAEVAADAAISKSKLATDVQNALDNAANAVAAPAGEKPANSVLGTDGDGSPVWYQIAM